MNRVFKPRFALMLASASLVSALSGCASKPASAPEPQAPAKSEQVAAQPEATAATAVAEADAPKATPYEDVLKRQQAEAEAKARQAKLDAERAAAAKRKAAEEAAAKAKPKPAPVVSKPAAKPEPKAAEPVRPPAPAPTDTVEKTIAPITVTLDKLPMTIEGNWILNTDHNTCTLQTVPKMMEDGAGKTPISLRLRQDDWLIHTKSDIDDSYPNSGLLFDGGKHIPLETIVKDTSVSIQSNKTALTEALKTAQSVTVSLGFWPTWPKTEIRQQAIPVAHFTQALAAWQTCNQLISAR